MVQTADVVVIGGGVTGCSIAYHLVQRGVRRVVVLEKSFLASGATGKSSACIRQHYSTPETCRMVRESLRFFETFEERTAGRTASAKRAMTRASRVSVLASIPVARAKSRIWRG